MAIVSIFFFFLVVVIYILIIKQHFRMPKKEKHQFPLLDFTGIWLIVLFGCLAIPDISLAFRAFFIGAGTLGVVLFGVFYNYWIRPKTTKQHFVQNQLTKTKDQQNKQNPPTETKTSKRTLISGLIIWSFDVAILWFFGIINWQYVSVNGVAIITYTDMVCILFLLGGFFCLIVDVWILRS